MEITPKSNIFRQRKPLIVQYVWIFVQKYVHVRYWGETRESSWPQGAATLVVRG